MINKSSTFHNTVCVAQNMINYVSKICIHLHVRFGRLNFVSYSPTQSVSDHNFEFIKICLISFIILFVLFTKNGIK